MYVYADTHTMHVAGLHSGTSEFESELITHCQEWKHSGIRNALGSETGELMELGSGSACRRGHFQFSVGGTSLGVQDSVSLPITLH